MTKHFILNKNIGTEIIINSRKPQSLYIQTKKSKSQTQVLGFGWTSSITSMVDMIWYCWDFTLEGAAVSFSKRLAFQLFYFHLFFLSLQVVWHSKWSKIPANRSFWVPDKYSHAVLHLLVFSSLQTCSWDLFIWEEGMQKARRGTMHRDRLLTGRHRGDNGSVHNQTLMTPPGHTNTQGNNPEPSQMWWIHG